MQSDNSNALARCQNKDRRVNLKSKRKRNLIKKAIELSRMLDMKILIVFKDLDTDKLSVYNSGDQIKGHFNLERVQREIRHSHQCGFPLKAYDDSHYEELKVISNYRNHKAKNQEQLESKEDQNMSIEFTGELCSNFQSGISNEFEQRISSSIKQAYDLCDEVLATENTLSVASRQLEMSKKCDLLDEMNSSSSIVYPDVTFEQIRQTNVGYKQPQVQEQDDTHCANFDCQSSYIYEELREQASLYGLNVSQQTFQFTSL